MRKTRSKLSFAKQSVFYISGLGADQRAFSRLQIPNTKSFFLNWIEPHRNESLADYARRFAASHQLQKQSQITFVGLSFGGLLAIELSRTMPLSRVILISSFKNRKELPPILRLLAKLNLHHLLPTFLLTRPNVLLDFVFGIESSDHISLFHKIIQDTDANFLRWALDRVNQWENGSYHSIVGHIHGDSDRILPIQYIQTCDTIPGGGHLMVLTHADLVSNAIRRILAGSNT